MKNSFIKPLAGFRVKAKTLLLFLVCLSQIALGQNYTLGKLDLILPTAAMSVDARALAVPRNLGIGDYAFHTRVGGISFEQIAQPDAAIQGKSVSIDFVDNHLVVTVGGQKFYPELPKWQLKPIANFANTDDKAVFTVYGDTTVNGQDIECLYHKAFLDNLLGLRLMQADILLKLEPMPNKDEMQTALRLLSWMGLPEEKLDLDSLYEIALSNYIPYWEIPKYKEKFLYANNEQNFVNRDVSTIQELEMTIISSKMIIIDFILGMNSFVKLFNGHIEQQTWTLTDYKKNIIFSIDNNTFKISGKPWYLFSTMDTEDNSIQLFEEESEEFNKECWELLKQYNPAVITAVENTAQWSAFFRYIKQNNPANWIAFMDKMSKISIDDAPDVITPIRCEQRKYD
jgi:hypothetical protein